MGLLLAGSRHRDAGCAPELSRLTDLQNVIDRERSNFTLRILKVEMLQFNPGDRLSTFCGKRLMFGAVLEGANNVCTWRLPDG